ncbi:MAG: SDR family oxidoreductase [Lachnospiraceae bacterium]|nr:SDR family oxidoreductase [Lachnospiraceae bacterium]
MANYLITGATSGIGRECVARLIKNENYVVAVGRDEQKLELLTEEFKDNICTIKYDLSNITDIGKIFEVSRKRNIIYDGMVYAAGVDMLCPIKVNSIEKTRYVMDVNCFAFIEMGKYFYKKQFSKANSSIVAISSISSLTNDIGMMSYSASKAALNSVVKTMSKEFLNRKIRVNAVLPAGVDTAMANKKNELLKRTSDDIIKQQGLGLIPVAQIIDEIVFLLSDNAEYMTGELITISGGARY